MRLRLGLFICFLVFGLFFALEKPQFANMLSQKGNNSGDLVSSAPSKLNSKSVLKTMNSWFEKNIGQWPVKILFGSDVKGAKIFITKDEIIAFLITPSPNRSALITKPGELKKIQKKDKAIELAQAIRLQFLNATPDSTVSGKKIMPGKVNYFRGNDPAKWLTNISTYDELLRTNMYEGVDVRYRFNEGKLEFDFLLAPFAEPKNINMKIHGARAIALQPNGSLLLSTKVGDIVIEKPKAYQEYSDASGKQSPKEVTVSYSLQPDNIIAIAIRGHDPSKKLIIDPAITYSTYLGGVEWDSPADITLDAAGNIYIGGTTESIDFPTANPYQATLYGSMDAFVTKLNPSGTSMLYSTFLGGSFQDLGFAMTVDPAGNVYIAGITFSFDFPTVNPIQASLAGAILYDYDTFFTKLDASGSSLVYSSYLGGSGGDELKGIAIDQFGALYITGYTFSSDFPTQNPIQGTFGGGGTDAFITKINSGGSSLVFSTYLGGTADDISYGIATDSGGNSYITGFTGSNNFPTASAIQPTIAGFADAFITKLNSNGSAFIFSTFLGGSGSDEFAGIFVDSAENVYLAGSSESIDFPTLNPVQASFAGGVADAIVTAINSTGSSLIYSTYLGGSLFEKAYYIVLDTQGNAYISGNTDSTDFPTANAVQPLSAGGWEIFVTKLNPGGATFDYSTYLGGSADDGVQDFHGLTLDSGNNAYICGITWSSDFPIVNPLQPTLAGLRDVFITKIEDTLCGDCNNDGAVNIIDALWAARHAARVITLTGVNFTNCNVLGVLEPDPAAVVNILDALNIARYAAGIPGVILNCR